MDVLIVERDELVAEVIADALADGGIGSVILHDEADAFAIPGDDVPRVVITGMNRRGEDLNGLAVARRLRSRWPALAVVYMAALWPARLQRRALSFRERFLAKPLHIAKLTATVRELLGCVGTHQPG
jgi:DNA-binding response OmpR family regulator